MKRPKHYLNSSLFESLVLIEYLPPVLCVRNLEHGDSFDWFGHFDCVSNGEPEMQLGVARHRKIACCIVRTAQRAGGCFGALTGIQTESIDKRKSSVRCKNRRLERALMNTMEWEQRLWKGQINQHPSTSLAAIPTGVRMKRQPSSCQEVEIRSLTRRTMEWSCWMWKASGALRRSQGI